MLQNKTKHIKLALKNAKNNINYCSALYIFIVWLDSWNIIKISN